MTFTCRICAYRGPDSSRYTHAEKAKDIHRALKGVQTQINIARRKGHKYIVLGTKKYRI